MGIKRTINKILGTDNPVIPKKADEPIQAPKQAPDKKSIATTIKIRHVGSLWQHKHDDLDWHTMSIPHPVLPADQDFGEDVTETLKEISQPADKEMRISKKDIFCKFVIQGKERIGETISIDSGLLVFKNGAENLSIPVDSILEITNEEVKVGEFDRDEALALGDEWISRTTDKLNFDEKGMLIND